MCLTKKGVLTDSLPLFEDKEDGTPEFMGQNR
jgi:hypothetical protein